MIDNEIIEKSYYTSAVKLFVYNDSMCNLKLIFIIYTDDTQGYGMRVKLQDVVIYLYYK